LSNIDLLGFLISSVSGGGWNSYPNISLLIAISLIPCAEVIILLILSDKLALFERSFNYCDSWDSACGERENLFYADFASFRKGGSG
jgi:hypothetical protein